MDSHMSICILFLTITVLMLLNVLITFKVCILKSYLLVFDHYCLNQLTERVEGLENIVTEINAYIEKATANVSDTVLTVDRKNPGNLTAPPQVFWNIQRKFIYL